MFKRIHYCGLCFIVALLIAGCSTPTPPAATATPTRTPPPQETATLAPTATPTPRPATPTATASPTKVVVEATPFPLDVNPLTGEKMASAEVLDRIPIAIKVSNSPEVRPQSGLNSADLVFEHLAEGNITRFTTIFYGEEPEQVGSVRSGRLIDLEIPAMYGALFGYSGSSAGVKERIRNSDLFPTYIAAPDFGVGEPYFYRVPQEGKAFEHTLFTNPAVLRKLADERGINKRPEFPRLMTFSEAPLEGGTPVSYFEVNYLKGTCTAEWTYDATSGRWKRATAGVPQTDYLTGDPITAANVVIVYANHIETDILEDTWGGGHQSIQVQIWGTGPVLVFRDGVMINGYWERIERNHMLTFWVAEGEPIALKPGNTWFQMVPLGTTSEEIQEGQLRFTPKGVVPFGG
jgi:hypothetical protein